MGRGPEEGREDGTMISNNGERKHGLEKIDPQQRRDLAEGLLPAAGGGSLVPVPVPVHNNSNS